MVVVRLLLFASIKQAANGVSELALELKQACWQDATQLKAAILKHLDRLLRESSGGLEPASPLLPDAASLMLAVNQQYVQSGSPITICDQDELALIPPVCGG